jgi:hypothetical protein
MNVSDDLIEVLKPIIRFGLSEFEGTRYFDEKIRSNKELLSELVKTDCHIPSVKFYLRLHDVKEAPICPECGTRMVVDCPAATCPNRECGEVIFMDFPESDDMCNSCISYKMRTCPYGMIRKSKQQKPKIEMPEGEEDAKRERQVSSVTEVRDRRDDDKEQREENQDPCPKSIGTQGTGIRTDG